MMLRALSLALLLSVTASASVAEVTESTVVAQEQQPVQQAPKRDCERRAEGVS
jgi:hypothetical protein